MKDLVKYIFEKIEEEICEDQIEEDEIEEASVVGNIGGPAPPLGGNSENPHASREDRPLPKSKSKKSVQYVLKNESLQNRIYSMLLEAARTPQLEDLSKQSLLKLLNHMIGNIDEDFNINISEKFAGQHMSVLIKGTNQGNIVYCATKDAFDEVKKELQSQGLSPTNEEIMDNKRFYRSTATSRKVKNSFRYSYKRLNPGESRFFGVEVIKPDYKKPDFIAYGIRHQIAIIYQGDITSAEAKKLSSRRFGIEFKAPEDVVRTPIAKDQMAAETIDTIEDLIQKVEACPKYTKAFIKREIKPTVKDILVGIFGYSLIGKSSPFEGVFIRLKSEEQDLDFKIPYTKFSEIQSISTSLYNHFGKEAKSLGAVISDSTQKINNFVADLGTMQNDSGELRKGSLSYNIVKFAATVSELNIDQNIRVFFSPEDFKTLCSLILDVFQDRDTNKTNELVKFMAFKISKFSKWHTNKLGDSFQNIYPSEIINLFNNLKNNL